MQVPRISRRIALSLLGLGAAAVTTSALAHPPRTGYRLDLETGGGQRLRRYVHHGIAFVLGTPGERYVVRVTNPTSERVEAVVTVDGRDAVSGRRGNYSTERGYIVPAYGSIVIEGFRSSLAEVRTFRFTKASASYSARLGTPENVGIVGVALFRERQYVRAAPPIARDEPGVSREQGGRYRTQAPAPAPETGVPSEAYDIDREVDAARDPRTSREDSAAPPSQQSAAPSQQSAAPSQQSAEGKRASRRSADGPWAERPPTRRKARAEAGPSNIGTEYGEARESRTVEAPFVRRAERPDVLLSIRYDDADGLTARGIDLYPVPRPPTVYHSPEAFPDSRFAPPPP